LVLFDSAFCDDRTLFDQLKPGGVLMINADERCAFDLPGDCKVGTVEALQISQQHGLGAIVNTAVLGAYVGLTRIVRLESLLKVIGDTVPAAVDENLNAAKEAYERMAASPPRR
jgi:pyruvate ferredoxin oxidoreductase gamma subunit